ncbi:MAG: HAD-IC family P-type ATPase, partial [Cytophagales bacterium]
FDKDKQDSFQTLVNKRSKYFTVGVLTIAFLAAAYWWWVAGAAMATKVFATVLIITCPCALALSAPFTLGNVMRVLSANGFFVKNSNTIEKIAKVDTLVFDKTGTLTDVGRESIFYDGDILNDSDYSVLISMFQNSSHPLSRAILKGLPNVQPAELEIFEEKSGNGLRAVINGMEWKVGSRTWVSAVDKNQAKGSEVWISKGGKVIGKFVLKNTYRVLLKNVFEGLKNLGFQFRILSGDSSNEASQLQELAGENVQMFFKQTPEEKLVHVQELNKKANKTMMLGDGLNDAGALKAAFVGVAVSNESLQFTPSSDAIIDGKAINKLDRLLAFCRCSMSLIKISFVISLAYNLIGISIAVQGLLTPLIAAIMMPLSSVTVVAFATLSSRYVAKNLKLYDDVYSVSTNRG